MGVELSAFAVDWPVLLAKIEEKPGRLRRGNFLFQAPEQASWLKNLFDEERPENGLLDHDAVTVLDPTYSTWVNMALAYDRVRGGIEPTMRDRYDRFAGAFFWMGTDHSPHVDPPVRDLGPQSDPEVFWSSFSPASVADYLALWSSLDLDQLAGPFEARKGHLGFDRPKARNAALFAKTFRPYFVQCGAMLEITAGMGRGLILSFL